MQPLTPKDDDVIRDFQKSLYQEEAKRMYEERAQKFLSQNQKVQNQQDLLIQGILSVALSKRSNSQTTSSFQIPEEVDEMNAEGFVNNVNIETQQKVEQFSFDFCSKDVPEKKMDVEGLIKEKSQGLIQEILSSALEKSKSLKQKKMKKLRKNNFDK
eukprot:gene5899-9727_t